MSKSRNIADLLDSGGDVKSSSLDNVAVMGAEIKTAYEAEADTNAFTDADHNKLSGIAAGANNYTLPSGLATETYVGTQISNLVDSSPAALNTLNELAAALGDDANFSTTVTNSIALKAPLASPSFTGTVSADGLVVEGASEIRSTLDATLNITSTAFEVNSGNVYGSLNFVTEDGSVAGDRKNAATIQAINSGGSGSYCDLDFYTSPGTGATNTKSLKIASNGDISFYGNTGTTPLFFWDASAGSLGIGTSSPATALDVVGTVTTDGLNVDGETTSSNGTYGTKLTYSIGNASGVIDTFGNHDLEFRANNSRAAKIATNGDISFYEDTGTTAKFFWDASAEMLGIGTSSPSALLEVESVTTSGTEDIAKFSRPTYGAVLTIGRAAGSGVVSSPQNLILSADHTSSQTSSNSNIILKTDGSEAMRINSSGTVLLGTSTEYDNGFSFLGSNHAYFRRANGGPLTLRRDSSDGSILTFNKDGTTVGSIGTYEGRVVAQAANALSITTNNTERMRINSSGDLLVSKTSGPNYNVVGVDITHLGEGQFTVNNGEVLQLNRQNSDGTIANFRKDGTTVGSIGTYEGRVVAQAANALSITTNNTERMRISSAGVDVTGSVHIDSGATDEALRIEGAGSPYMSWYDSGVRQAYIGSFGSTFYITGDTPDTQVKIATGGVNRASFNSSGLDVTGNVSLPDNGKATFGASDDLQIYHDGWSSVITNSTGNLIIRDSVGGNILIQGLQNQPSIDVYANGAVKTYYSGNLRTATTSSGLDVTGDITVSGTVDGRDVAADGSKLDGIEASATADQTAAQITALGIAATSVTGSQASAITANTAKVTNSTSATDLTSGTLADARFPATLPAISGANLTNLPAGGVGEYIGNSIAISSNNTALANDDGTSNNNVGIGTGSGASVTSGNNNTLIGNQAAPALTTGSYNSVVGAQVAESMTGSQNVIMGFSTANNLTTGSSNIALGTSALRGNPTSKLTGSYNIGIGPSTGFNLTSGQHNFLSGYHAGYDLSTGQYNVLQGYQAGYNATTATNTIAIGKSAMGTGVATGADNIAIGRLAGQDLSSGANNTFLGVYAGANTTTGGQNNGLGAYAMGGGATTGSYNTAIGYQAGFALTSGEDNIFLGRLAGNAITVGRKNIAIGSNALKSVPKAYGNVAVGDGALYSFNYANEVETRNTAIGYQAGYGVTTGLYSTLIGAQAGSTLTTGSNNICIGIGAQPSSAVVSNEITLGDANVLSLRIPGMQSSATSGDVLTYNGSKLVLSTPAVTLGANLTSFTAAVTLPTSDGTAGQALVSDGSGVVSFAGVNATQLGTKSPAYYDDRTINVLGSVVGATNINLANGTNVTATITGATTFTISGITSGSVNTVTLYLTNAGAYSITWPSGTTFNRNSAPILPASGGTIIVLETYDNATSYAGIQVWRSV